MHTGTKRYECSVCSKGLRCKDSLKRHMLTHKTKAERSVKCPYCQKWVVGGDCLKDHFRKAHADLKLAKHQIMELTRSLKPDVDKMKRELGALFALRMTPSK